MATILYRVVQLKFHFVLLQDLQTYIHQSNLHPVHIVTANQRHDKCTELTSRFDYKLSHALSLQPGLKAVHIHAAAGASDHSRPQA